MARLYLKGLPGAEFQRHYLSEGELQMHFSLPKMLYYSCVRPAVPIPMRQRLQQRVNRRVDCRNNFIWPEFVELVRRNEADWVHMTSILYPSGCESAIVLTHDVETQEGYDYIPTVMELEARYGFKSSWNLVAKKYELRREITDHIVSCGHEIGIHGFNHDGTLYYSRQRFRTRARHINDALHRYGAVGFRSPQVHRDLEWLQELDVLYDASCFDYDPYQPFPGGTGCIWPFMAGKFVELPYTVPQDHTLFYVLRVTGIDIWKAKTRWLLDNKGMVLVLTHPDYLRDPRHLRWYEKYLEFLNAIPNAWRALPREIANRYKSL